VVSNGTVNGNAVAFDLSTADNHNTGTILNETISGRAMWRFTDGARTVMLNGNFAASKLVGQ
jgi:hypothetical protein